MIRAVIIDDEEAGIQNLKNVLEKHCGQVNVVAVCSNYNNAKDVIDTAMPDLVFLDIEMPLGSGFNILAQYHPIPFQVVFVTAYDKYALKAIRFAACDYVLKPIITDELVAAVHKAVTRIELNGENAYLKNLLANIKAIDKDKRIALAGLESTIFIKVSDIIRCEADRGYTWFFFTNREKLLATKNLGEYEALLSDKGFIRIHHADLVNCNHIVEFKKANTYTVIMSDGSQVNVSQRKRDVLLEYLNKTTT